MSSIGTYDPSACSLPPVMPHQPDQSLPEIDDSLFSRWPKHGPTVEDLKKWKAEGYSGRVFDFTPIPEYPSSRQWKGSHDAWIARKDSYEVTYSGDGHRVNLLFCLVRRYRKLDIEVVKFLMRRLWSFSEGHDNDGRTILHWAALNERKDIFDVLLKGFTDEQGRCPGDKGLLGLVDYKGKTALDLAVQ